MRTVFYYLVIFINSNSFHDVYWQAAVQILKNIEKIPELNITEVAEMCYVSTATISRLCRKLNYDSFYEFKADVINCLEHYGDNSRSKFYDEQLPDVSLVETDKEAVREHFYNIQSNLQETFDHLDYPKLLKMVDMMHEAQRIFFLGNYYTQSCANQLQIELIHHGKESIASYPLAQQKEAVKHLKEGDLVVVSTIAGSYIKMEPEIIKAITQSKAKTIVISQLDHFERSDAVDMIFKVGNKRNSLVGKFSITYVFELLELLYHVRYER